MNIIEYIAKNLKIPCEIIFSLFIGCIISQLLIINTAVADTVAADENDNWFAGTWLDGSWMPQSLQIHGFLSQGFIHWF